MNILIITGIFPPDIGGPASYVPSIARDLILSGHHISVITLSDSTSHSDQEFPFPVIRLRRSLPKSARLPMTVQKILQHGYRADIIFVHGLALEAVLCNILLRKPLVQKVVGDLAWERARTFRGIEDSIETFQQKKYSFPVECIKKLRSFWVKKSSLVIAPSNYLKIIIQGWGVSREKIKVVYNAVPDDTDISVETSAPFLQHDHIGKKIVSVGRLVPWKGFDDLIRVAGRFQNVHLTIIGEGPDRKKLQYVIQEEHVQDRVILSGSLTRSEVFSRLKQSDLFVLNSTYEGLPHIVLEAMAAGLPVIATDTGGTGELVRDGYNGLLVPPLSPRSLEHAIRKVLDADDLKKRFIQNGYSTLQKFNWKTLVEATEEILAAEVKKGTT